MSNKFVDKVKYIMGLDDYEEEEEEVMETTVNENNENNENITPITSKKNKVVNIHHTASQMKVVLYEPNTFEESCKIVDNLKNRKPVVVNLENLDPELARKIFDFLSGSIYALDGSIQKISHGIFILAPNNVDIAGKPNEESGTSPFPWYK